ncbi:MAG: 23S rRNA (pseudouridine(1915)-N(3))-methyltransferase RlmH [Clostridia bacterium]|nr:23S rRNA (pseudouridine(1915)-N(3))-methyltransferase RlmH [Clostridia bacterium]
MIKVNIVCIGKIKESFFREAYAEYAKRLSRFCSLELIELDEFRGDNVEKVKEEECKKLQKALRGRKIALDLRGEQLDSPSFAKILKESVNKGEEISFVIGGSNGLTREFVAGCDKSISFGKLTFPHQLFRVLLVEQIYRGFMINADSGYHK